MEQELAALHVKHTALRGILEFLPVLEPADRARLHALLQSHKLPSGAPWLAAAAASRFQVTLEEEAALVAALAAAPLQHGTLVHSAARVGDAALLSKVLLAVPAAAMVAVEYSVELPLHCAARSGHAAAVQCLLDAAPAAATVADSHGALPLHLAAHSGRPATFEHVLTASPPGAVEAADVDGCLPLHYAAGADFEEMPTDAPAADRTEVLRAVLALAPAAAAVPDSSGNTPLHYAAASHSVEGVALLLDAAPAAATQPNEDGCLPLHWAACNGDPAVSQLLLARFPEAARTADQQGRLPLHFAAAKCNLPAVAALLAAAPATAAAVGGSGLLPLHRALRSYKRREHPDAVRTLAAATPAPAALAALAAADDRELALPLFAEVVRRTALSAEQWDLVPSPCPGLAAALPAVHARGHAEAGQLVRRLPAEARARLRTAAVALARAVPAAVYESRILPHVAD